MPCNSDHMNPTADEAYSKKVAIFIGYVTNKMGIANAPWIEKAAADTYGAPRRQDELSAELCRLIKMLSPAEREAIVFNAHDATARSLAEWVERHEKVDAERERDENDKIFRVAYMLTNGSMSISDRVTRAEADRLIATRRAQGVVFIQKTRLKTAARSLNEEDVWEAVS